MLNSSEKTKVSIISATMHINNIENIDKKKDWIFSKIIKRALLCLHFFDQMISFVKVN